MNASSQNTLLETLNITFTNFGDDFLEATMPVNSAVHQPQGLLHGGATVALAESVGSMGSYFFTQGKASGVVGLEINANHIRSTKKGSVRARGVLVHRGRTTHVWEIKAYDDDERLLSTCRMTTMILYKS